MVLPVFPLEGEAGRWRGCCVCWFYDMKIIFSLASLFCEMTKWTRGSRGVLMPFYSTLPPNSH